MFWGKKFNSHKHVLGFSSLEIMVAIGILATIFILAMPFFSQQGKIIKQLRTSSNCQAILDTAFSRINSFGNSLDAYKPKANAINSTGATVINKWAFSEPTIPVNKFDPDFQFQRTQIFKKLIPSAVYSTGALYSKNPGITIQIPTSATTTDSQPIAFDGVTLYTPLLLKGSMEYLATKYNYGHCDTFAPVKLLTAADSNALSSLFQGGLKNLNLSMKVSRYDLVTNNLSYAKCGDFWPRPRNATRSDVVYEPSFGKGTFGSPRMTIGKFPQTIQDKDGFRVTMRASYINDKGQQEDCDGTKDFSLPEDKQNVVDYFYDVSYVKAPPVGAAPPTAGSTNLQDNITDMRAGTKCNSSNGNCLGHPFETIYTNLQPYSATNPNWPENRDRPICTQKPIYSTDMVISIRVYNPQKEPGLVPMCLDTSQQWFKNSPGNWCPGSWNDGVETSFDKSWGMRYTGWVPCEHMMFCNSQPDQVEVVNSTGNNSKFTGASVDQPYVEYRYHYNKISGDKNNPRMWGCEIKFGVAMLDMAGNLSYVPAKEAPLSSSDPTNPLLVAGDTRPPIKEINPHVYFKPPPCYTCNCKPCKGGKGLFGGLFNWLLFVVLVVAGGGLFGIMGALIAGILCLSGGLGCYSGGGVNYVPKSDGGKYRSCDDSDNGSCKCGQKCSAVRPPGPSWASPYIEGLDISKIESNSCEPGSTFYLDGVPMSSVGGMVPTLAYKTLNGTGGAGYTYYMDKKLNKIQPGTDILWSAFDSANARFCYVATRCSNGRLNVVKETSDIPTDPKLYPLMGCSPVKVGTEIKFNASPNGISQGSNMCLEVEFTSPSSQNPLGNKLWNWSDFNEQCSLTNTTGGISTDTRLIAGSCPQTSGNATMSIPGGAVQNQNGAGCAKGTSDSTDLENINFACKMTKLTWDDCAGSIGIASCPMWCYAACTPPKYAPEHKFVENPDLQTQRYYENMTAADKDLPFCTMKRDLFDAGYK